MRDYGFLITHRGFSSHSWSLLLRSIATSKISLPFFIFPNSFVHLFSLFYTYPHSLFFSLFSFPLLVTILSHFSKMTDLWVGRLIDPHLHPYYHIMSPTKCRIILYLTIFTVVGSWVQAIAFRFL